MYIRQISRTNKDGSRVRYLQLAHKVRDPETGAPRDQILAHLGREDQLDRGQIERLIQSLARFLDPAARAAVDARVSGTASDLEVERSLAFGGGYVLDHLWRRLGIAETLTTLLRKRSFQGDLERLLFALVANRALEAGSKLSLERWIGRRGAVPGLESVQVHALYRAMDFLHEHSEEIQKAVFFSVATLLNLEVDLVFFDTTTTYVETEEEDEGEDALRRYGHSKDHRPDLPQVVIGLAVTRDGIPVRCWVLPGNTADASTVEQVQQDLAGWKLSRVVWVMDRGMAGEEQRRILQRGGGQLILGERLRSGEASVREALSRPGRYQKVRENLEVKEITVSRGSERRRFVLVRNPVEAERDRHRREAALERLRTEIERLNDGRRRRGAAHTKAVCALKTHPSLGRYVKELKNGELRIDAAKVAEEEKLDGKYLLTTTDPSLSAEDVALGYKQLADVERAFRTLKTTLELRPLYHRLPDRIRSHVLLCWLALLLVRLAERESGLGWGRCRELLQEIHRVDLKGKDGTLQLTSTLTDEHRKLLKSLRIDPPPRIQKAEPTLKIA
jgi:transposase